MKRCEEVQVQCEEMQREGAGGAVGGGYCCGRGLLLLLYAERGTAVTAMQWQGTTATATVVAGMINAHLPAAAAAVSAALPAAHTPTGFDSCSC